MWNLYPRVENFQIFFIPSNGFSER